MNMEIQSGTVKAPLAKICGLSTAEDVDAALIGGAAYLGFMAWPPSRRHITPINAGHLAASARGNAKVVAVVVDADDAWIDEIMRDLAPDYVQLHGNETPERADALKRRTGARIIRAVRVGSIEDILSSRAFDDVADHMLYDARAPEGSEAPGGNGVAFDWSVTSAVPRGKPWFLAGGLNPQNVTEALRQTGAPLVDVSSGVERSPGCKDPFLIKDFLFKVRDAAPGSAGASEYGEGLKT
jgi:phosphoribosylanthranilate isomerase